MSLPRHQRAVWLLGAERLELRVVPLSAPSKGEVVVKIAAALTCGTDLKVFRRGGHPSMLVAPSPFGHECAGTIAAVGPEVASWQVGERVAVANSAPCGSCRRCLAGRQNLCLDLHYLNGAFAEYLTVPARFTATSLHTVPAALAFEVAALAEPLACVLHGLDRTPLLPNSQVLVIGAGAIGLLWVAALARQGHRVTVVDPHPNRLELAKALGATATRLLERTDGISPAPASSHDFDAAIETSASASGWEAAWAAVRTGGAINLFAGPAAGTRVPLDLHALHYRELVVIGAYHHRPPLFARALELLATGSPDGARLLSSERPLEEVGEALRAMARRDAIRVVIRPG